MKKIFSWLYGAVVWLRNKLFDRGILPVEQFAVPVISVGNLTVGGTGKTPHTEYLIRLLSPNYRVAVLSRGYKRLSKGFVLADATASAKTIGDEPFQMFRKFPNILVAVDSNRRRGIRHLLALPEKQRPEVILLDDAFQHRYVKPSLSILLMNSRRLPQNDALLPAGRLREPAKNANRADIIIYTKCNSSLRTARNEAGSNPAEQLDCFGLYPRNDVPEFATTYRYGDLLPVFDIRATARVALTTNEKKAVLLLAGLADPTDFIAYVRKTYATDLQTLIFPDHHHFTKRDAEEIEKAFKLVQTLVRRRLQPASELEASLPACSKAGALPLTRRSVDATPNNTNENVDATPNAELPLEGAEGLIITSEKDAVRLRENPFLSEHIKDAMFYLPIEVQFLEEQEEKFKQIIENHVKQFKRNSSVSASADSGSN
ncbi:hypothetical protein FACS1894162_8230 [Bacteroidia bacterium]|nr:hypothetical protein FACS1894162_8230 [Bacteroidia bacterium]